MLSGLPAAVLAGIVIASVIPLVDLSGFGDYWRYSRPQFLVVLDPAEAAWAVGVGLAMALTAALLPARVVAGLAPAEVFRR